MNIDIKNPLDLLLEMSYINGALNGKELPEMINLNEIFNEIYRTIKGSLH